MPESRTLKTAAMDHYKNDSDLHDISDEKPVGAQLEQAQMLADLPDPDAGKSDEERAAIVRVLPTNEARDRSVKKPVY